MVKKYLIFWINGDYILYLNYSHCLVKGDKKLYNISILYILDKK